MVRRIRPANEDADDALIGEAVERASWEQFTREPPKTLQGRINFLLEQLKTTKAVAQELGVSRRSVERYRKGERKHPPRALADRIDAAVRTRWQPRVRSQRQEARRHHGWDHRGGPGAVRLRRSRRSHRRRPLRRLTVRLPASYAKRLFDAQQGRSTESPNEGIAEGLQEVYFKTTATAPTTFKLNLRISTTSTSITEGPETRNGEHPLLNRSAIGVTKAGLLSPRSAALSSTENLDRRTRSRVPQRADVVGAPEAV